MDRVFINSWKPFNASLMSIKLFYDNNLIYFIINLYIQLLMD